MTETRTEVKQNLLLRDMTTKFSILLLAFSALLFTSCKDTDINDAKTLDNLKTEINTAVQDGDNLLTIQMKCSGNKMVSWDIHDVQVFYTNATGEERIYTIPFTNREIEANDQSLVDVALEYYRNSPASTQKNTVESKRRMIKTKGRAKADFDNATIKENIDSSLKILEENDVRQVSGIQNYTIYLDEDASHDKHEWTILAYSTSKKTGRLVTTEYAQYKFMKNENGEVVPTK